MRAIVVLLIGWAPAVVADEIGTVALAQNEVIGTNGAGGDRALLVGNPIFQDELVRTTAQARAEFLFLDQTSLAMGPNTELVLDRFVFDPSSQNGEMALSLGKGALRFIGGALSDNSPAIIKTPTATIGIRGSSALISITDQGTQAIFLAGDEMCVSSSSGSACTSQLGGILTQEGYQGQATPEDLEQSANEVEGEIEIGGATGPVTPITTIAVTEQVPPNAPPVSTRGTPVDTIGTNTGLESTPQLTLPIVSQEPILPIVPEEPILPTVPEDPILPSVPEEPEVVPPRR